VRYAAFFFPAFHFARRALWAAAIFRHAAADIGRLFPTDFLAPDGPLPSSLRSTEIALSSFLIRPADSVPAPNPSTHPRDSPSLPPQVNNCRTHIARRSSSHPLSTKLIVWWTKHHPCPRRRKRLTLFCQSSRNRMACIRVRGA
jgi:hypothetical protein